MPPSHPSGCAFNVPLSAVFFSKTIKTLRTLHPESTVLGPSTLHFVLQSSEAMGHSSCAPWTLCPPLGSSTYCLLRPPASGNHLEPLATEHPTILLTFIVCQRGAHKCSQNPSHEAQLVCSHGFPWRATEAWSLFVKLRAPLRSLSMSVLVSLKVEENQARW
jgi:hypothetical protein